MEGRYSRVTFRVRALSLRGQTVALTGSADALGRYSKQHFITLVTTPEAYPIWYTPSPVILPLDEVTRYKYCIVENGVFHAYESLDGMEREVRPQQVDVCVEDVYNPARARSSSDSEGAFIHEDVEDANDPRKNAVAVKGQSLFITCYHLPVVVQRKNNEEEPFEVTWAESIIAKSEDSVSNSMSTHWIGLVFFISSNFKPYIA